MSGPSAELEFELVGGMGTTRYQALRQDPPWKIVRGFQHQTGECMVHLNNVSGGVFGGDVLRLRATLRTGAQAQITTTGATRLYRPRAEAEDARLHTEFHLESGAMLEYLPDALIPFEHARALQRTAFFLEEGATLFAWDTIAPGRAASGERFRYESLRLVTELKIDGKPLLNERLLLVPGQWPMHSPGRYGHRAAYLVTLLAVQAGATKSVLQALEADLNGMLAKSADRVEGDVWGVTTLPAHGLMVRGMVQSSLGIPALLHALWALCKQSLTGRHVTPPRKLY